MTIDNREEEFVSVSGGYLVQDKDNFEVAKEDMKVVTDKAPTDDQWDAMLLGWKVIPSVKVIFVILSNTETNGRDWCRSNESCWLCKIALERAIEINDNVALVSDGFFPMDDTVELVARMVLKLLFNLVVQLKTKIQLIWRINMALLW